MAHSPSTKWEDGKMTERAQDARGAVEENEAEAKADRPYKIPPPNSTFSSRRDARLGRGKKAVERGETEDKSVKSSRTARK